MLMKIDSGLDTDKDMKKILMGVLSIAIAILAVNTQASSMGKLAVYVLAQDAKFIGDYTGGAQVTVYHSDSRAILAQGITQGGTGNTKRIMESNHLSAKIDKEAAFFLADVSVDKPTPVTIEVKGPLKYPQSVKQLSISAMVYPDRPVHPVVIPLPGYIVEGTLQSVGQYQLQIAAKVRMLCGCNLSPDGYWRSGNAYVWAEVFRGDVRLASIALDYTKDSAFAANLDLTNAATLLPDRVIIHARALDGLHTGIWQQDLNR